MTDPTPTFSSDCPGLSAGGRDRGTLDRESARHPHCRPCPALSGTHRAAAASLPSHHVSIPREGVTRMKSLSPSS
ncbi:MAG TPA: hypothetical protein DDZ58_13695, partial [Achromobacter sp.]|nr:hypothetical protein [Achromobacter sp.]